MTPAQRWKLNDGMLRTRINEGDAFRYIGQDPSRTQRGFDLTGSELLRLDGRNIGIEYVDTVPAETRIQIGTAGAAFGQPGGASQILLLDRIPPANFGLGVPLGPR